MLSSALARLIFIYSWASIQIWYGKKTNDVIEKVASLRIGPKLLCIVLWETSKPFWGKSRKVLKSTFGSKIELAN